MLNCLLELQISQEQNGLESEEIGIIAGALDIKSKTVKDIMLPLDNVFMVSSKAALDVQLLKSIEESGNLKIKMLLLSFPLILSIKQTIIIF